MALTPEAQQVYDQGFDEGYEQGRADEYRHILHWLIDNNIVRQEMFELGGLVAVNCNDLTVQVFKELGARDEVK